MRFTLLNFISIKLHKVRFYSKIPRKKALNETFNPPSFREDSIPKQSDILIIGGGLVGWACAYWIRALSKVTVTVVEKDPSHSKTSSYRGLGGLKHQFSLPENIQLSKFAAEFMRNLNENLETTSEKRVIIDFNPVGHLLLANDQTADQLKEDLNLQKALGCSIEPLLPDQIKTRWPWLNTHDIAFATHGLENEGWFNPSMLLQALKWKSHELGVNYVTAELINIKRTDFLATNITMAAYPERQPFITQAIRYAVLRTLSGQEYEMTFSSMVNAAGPWAKDVARMAGIGTSEIPLPLPVEKVLVHAFLLRPAYDIGYDVTYCPGVDAPFLVDFDGLNVQRVGLSGDFIVYRSASPADVVDSNTSEDDLIWLQNCPEEFVNEFYTSTLRQAVENRIPAFKDAKVCNAWSTFDDLNTFDRTPVVGFHPLQLQMLFACGMSGYGAQHCLGIGRGIAELLLYRDFRTIDLSSFSFNRFYIRETVSDQSNVCNSHILA